MLQTISPPSFAHVVAFYGEPLPHESRGRGYMATIIAARMAALRSVIGEDQAIRYTGRQATAAPAAAPRKVGKARKSMTAEQFFDAYQAARRTVAERHGLRWVVDGQATWATVPAGWRSFKGPRGGKVTLPKDIRIPAAHYWPGGRIPPELVLAEPAPAAGVPWVVGYGRDGEHVLLHPFIARLQAAHRDAIEDEQRRKAAALEVEPVEETDAREESC